jgi:hypothetical protein
MQPLPKGITGFDAPNYGVSVKQFTSACHAAARQAKGLVEQVQQAYGQVTPNFHEAVVTILDGSKKVRVLCNAYYPIVAFASPSTFEGDSKLQFIDCQELAVSLGSEFRIFGASEATAAISPDAITNLGATELQQMRYWRPERIGEVIFNHWD